MSNFNNESFGSINLTDATAHSVNTVYAQLAADVGLKQIASTIYAYPTFASLVLKSAEKFNKKRLTPRARAITGWLYRRSRK